MGFGHTYLDLIVKWCPLDHFFTNPYHLAGSVLARLVINGVTLTWAAIILFTKDALVRSGSRYAFVTEYIAEDSIAATLAVICLLHLLLMWRHCRPNPMINFGYALLTFAWGFAFFSIVGRPGPVQATSATCTLWVALIALYAFLDAKPVRVAGEPSVCVTGHVTGTNGQ